MCNPIPEGLEILKGGLQTESGGSSVQERDELADTLLLDAASKFKTENSGSYDVAFTLLVKFEGKLFRGAFAEASLN